MNNTTTGTDSRPNILVFFTDQQRWDTCGCYGQSLPVTPNLDQMAREGVRFEHAFTCQPVCGPARACLQTGLYATQINVCTNDIALPLHADTIAKQFSAAGYATGYVGKWHLASSHSTSWFRPGPNDEHADFRTRPVPPERRGGYRDYWVASDVLEFTSHGRGGGHMFDAQGNKREWGADRYRADAVTDYALEFLRSRPSGQPWLLFLSHIEPHHQNDHNRYEGPPGSAEQFRNYTIPADLTGTQGDWQENYPDYLGCCHSLDQNLGRIRSELASLGMLENTIVIFTSDHGSHFRTRNDEYKRSCHDNCIRIPMVISGPGFQGNKVVHDLVSLIDIPRTILEAARIQPPDLMQGYALQPLAQGRSTHRPEEIFLQISESQVGRAIRTQRWKYSVRAPDLDGRNPNTSSVYVEDFLYDLQADPHEKNNLVHAKETETIRQNLRELLIQRMISINEPRPTIIKT